MATITVINGRPHAYYTGIGPLPVRGESSKDAEALDNIVALALLTGCSTTTAPGLNVVPDLPRDEETRRPIGFRPR